MSKVIVLLTALPFTKGHQYLINWANWLALEKNKTTCVIVGTQPHEPMGWERFKAIETYCHSLSGLTRQIMVEHYDEVVQQRPKDENDHKFWNDWVENMLDFFGEIDPDDYIVSSEAYGATLAKYAGCKSLICDPYRDVVKTKATDIRMDPEGRWNDIAEEMKYFIRPTVTLLGAESVGKTTLAKDISKKYCHLFVHEWARPYLETLPSPETTAERMEEIVYGQHAAQMAAVGARGSHKAIVQDTDLLATIGYYRLYCKDYEKLKGYQTCVELFKETKSDMYFLCSTLGMPFTPDPLRYGGDKRESFDEFWCKLLIEYECEYRAISSSDQRTRIEVINQQIDNLFWRCPIWGYERE